MPANSKRRTRRTKEDWAAAIKKHKESGLSAREFCRRENLVLGSFRRWKQRESGSSSKKFVELTSATDKPATTTWELDIELPNGIRLEFKG